LAVFFEGTDEPPVESDQVAWPAGLPQQGVLTEYQSGQVFAALGVPVAQSALVSPDTLKHSVPYPVVVKISSPDIPHKTEAGGVKVNVADDAALRVAAAEIMNSVKGYKADAVIDGLLVQSMSSKLLELILGYRLDPLVGPTVLLGAGGITAELLPDVALRLAPVSKAQAWDMIRQVKSTQLVRGWRGLPEGDCESLAQAIVDVSRLAMLKDVRVLEAEINPLFVKKDGVVAVDGLIILDQ